MSEKITFQERMQTLAGAIQSNKYISAITNALMSLLPIMMVGAIGSLINGMPIDAWQSFLTSSGLKTITSIPNEVTNNLLALYAVFLIAVKFAESHDLDGVPAGMLSLMAFLVITPLLLNDKGAVLGLSGSWLGAKGLFTAFFMALIVGKIYVEFQVRGWTIKMPSGVPPTVTKSFSGLIPGFVILLFAVAIRFIFIQTSYGDIHNFIFQIVAAPLTALGSSFPAALVAVIMIHVFWLFGIHGTLVIIAVFTPLWTPLANENLAAFNALQPIPNLLTQQLVFQAIVTGSGQTIGLTIAMLFAKSKQYRTLGRLAVVPNLCGINEPIIFGTPIVMNFKMAIPFILTPTLSFVLAYLLTSVNILPRLPGIAAPLGTPAVVAGLLISAGDWRWAVFQVGLIALSYAIYRPFFTRIDRDAYQAEISAQSKEA